jgi:serine/threonine-protein kinase
MRQGDAILHRIQSLGLVDAAGVKEAERAVEGFPALERPSIVEWLVASGRLRPSTLDAIREELARPQPWWGRLRRDAVQAARETLDEGLVGSEEATRRHSGGPGEEPSSPEPGVRYPLPHWPRFEPVAFLGEGGMGKVFKAFDPTLRRLVALKFLHFGHRPGALETLLGEARAQAQLDHPHVVRLLEAGEIEGLAYLVLAFVDGVSLKELHLPLSLRQQVALLEGAAEGVHAIHRLGIVHRDLKPANILVRRRENGGLEALVTDFGVARNLRQESGLPRTVVGTPLYMSPEQARGDPEVDRRSDVYSLGATLYHVLLGAPPFPDAAGAELLQRVLHEAPVRPRQVSAAFPEDLEAILLKCLEKEAERRYPSALDLASDLERYLAGQPVLARPAPPLHRVRLWARRNRLLAAGLALSAGVVLASGGFALKTWTDRRTAVALAQRWSADVAQIEAARRQIHMLPTRDVGPELERLATRQRFLEGQVAQAPEAAQGAGHFVLARAAMAQGQWTAAARRLEQCAQAGYRGPDADLARGEVNAHLYLAALQEIERLPGPELRAKRVLELEQGYRDPALRDLRTALQGGAASTLSGALLAMLEKAPDLAVARASGAFDAEPWRYEAKLLEAEIRMNQARALRLSGGYQQGLDELERADPAVRVACDVGRSDPEAWLAQATRWELTVQIARHLGGRRFDAVAKAEEACRIAETCRPGYAPALALRGRLRYQQADMQADRADPAEGYREAAVLMEAALRADPGRSGTCADLVELQVSWGLRRMQQGEDPSGLLQAAIATGRKGLAQRPTEPRLMNLVGLAWLHGGGWTRSSGGDPGFQLDQAEALFRAIEALDPRLPFAQNNLGWVSLERARWQLQRGEDPSASVDLADRHLRNCIELNPNSAHSRQLMGDVAALRARWMLDHGRDPLAVLDRARAELKRALEINPLFPATFITACRVEAARAEALARTGRKREAAEALADLEGGLRRLQEISPGRIEAELERGRLLALRGRGSPSGAGRAGARQALARVLARQPGNPDALALLKSLG